MYQFARCFSELSRIGREMNKRNASVVATVHQRSREADGDVVLATMNLMSAGFGLLPYRGVVDGEKTEILTPSADLGHSGEVLLQRRMRVSQAASTGVTCTTRELSQKGENTHTKKKGNEGAHQLSEGLWERIALCSS
ncbi:hypothetical protein TcCL_NonESM03678 [Trypanosoma cruzi]|nr:hypothetical protein TcCL_NonESM03678 [Trypanosoma cruzi]